MEGLSLCQRFRALFAQLGVSRAHVPDGGQIEDLVEIGSAAPDLFCSVVQVCPFLLPADPTPLTSRPALVIHGDQGEAAGAARRRFGVHDHVRFETLADCRPMLFDDVVVEHADVLLGYITEFLQEAEAAVSATVLDGPEIEVTVAGISCRSFGAGPALVLFPFAFAPHQWRRWAARTPPFMNVCTERAW